MSPLRNVTVLVSNVRTGDMYLARSYPDDDYNNNGRIELYRVPVYIVEIKGTDGSNKPQTKTWKALRFMPYWNDPASPKPNYRTKGWANAGLHSLAKKAVTFYNPHYGVQNRHSPYAGAIQMRDSFLIHAGPKVLTEHGWGSAGCVEVVGDFDKFRDDIKMLSGFAKPRAHDAILEMVRARTLFVQVNNATPPDLKASFVREV